GRVSESCLADRVVLVPSAGRRLTSPHGSVELSACLEASSEVVRGAQVLALLRDTGAGPAPTYVLRAVELMLARLLETASAERVEALRARLDTIPRGLEGHAESEGEYKYLLREAPPATVGAERERLSQGYVPGERLHERLRRVQRGTTVRYLRTVKLGSGLARVEIEEETSQAIFDGMWPLTEGHRVE